MLFKILYKIFFENNYDIERDYDETILKDFKPFENYLVKDKGSEFKNQLIFDFSHTRGNQNLSQKKLHVNTERFKEGVLHEQEIAEKKDFLKLDPKEVKEEILSLKL
jgi:hypothetical protein